MTPYDSTQWEAPPVKVGSARLAELGNYEGAHL